MNYRHAYHAGNHADVLKHAVLARVFTLLKAKNKPFAFLDAHGGAGAYDLEGNEAGKTGEWEGGIGKLATLLAPAAEELLAPYRKAVAAINPGGRVRFYPGSPEVAAHLLRREDRIIVNELHPEDADTLARSMGKRATVTVQDAGQAVRALLPFAERRGVVLIDPPYEQKDETAQAVKMLQQAHRRMGTGVLILWYPVKGTQFAAALLDAVKKLALPETLRVELRVREAFEGGGLAGSGLVIVNPPWKLDEELGVLMPALASRLGLGSWGRGDVEWLTPPR
jgi:23S rRNA (adenine2030-N6)-methyltransferase